MPTFKYRVRDRLGKAMAGTIEAPTIEVAGNHLYQTGYFPVAVELLLASAVFLPWWNMAKLFK